MGIFGWRVVKNGLGGIIMGYFFFFIFVEKKKNWGGELGIHMKGIKVGGKKKRGAGS